MDDNFKSGTNNLKLLSQYQLITVDGILDWLLTMTKKHLKWLNKQLFKHTLLIFYYITGTLNIMLSGFSKTHLALT